jgi:hypothetical protein
MSADKIIVGQMPVAPNAYSQKNITYLPVGQMPIGKMLVDHMPVGQMLIEQEPDGKNVGWEEAF